MIDALFRDSIASASIIELIWILNAVVGMTLSQRNLREALTDYRALGDIRNGRRTIAVNTLTVESILLTKFFLYFVAGLFAITSPGGPPSIVGIVVSMVLIIGSFLLTVISWSNRKTSGYLLSHGLQNRDAKGKFIKSTNTAGDDITEANQNG